MNLISNVYRRICAFFLPHYISLSEQDFQSFDFPPSHHLYDCEAIKDSFKDSTLECCGQVMRTSVDVTALYGGRGVRVLREGRCLACKQDRQIEIRFRDGYLMAKDEAGRWFMFIRQQPIIWQLLKGLIARQP